MSYSVKVLDHYENPRNVGSFAKEEEGGVGTGMVADRVGAKRTLVAGLMRGFDGPGDQAQHGGVVRTEELRHGLVRPVDGERVLDEVVRPEREEIHLGGVENRQQNLQMVAFQHQSITHRQPQPLASLARSQVS